MFFLGSKEGKRRSYYSITEEYYRVIAIVGGILFCFKDWEYCAEVGHILIYECHRGIYGGLLWVAWQWENLLNKSMTMPWDFHLKGSKFNEEI